MSCDDCGESVGFSREEMRRATKRYWCCACPEHIEIGDKYTHTVVGSGGHVDTWRHCLRCFAMWSAIAHSKRDREFGDLVQFDLDCGHTWQETHFGQDPPPEVARLAFMTREEAQREFAAK